MFVCACRAVTDRTVAEALASGCTDLDELVSRSGAGARCGGCRPLLAELLAGRGVTVAIRSTPATAA